MNKPLNTDAVIKWEGRTIRLSYHPQKWGFIDHLELRVDGDEPIPITNNGYKSHFFGPMSPSFTIYEVTALVRDWLGREAKSQSWIESEAARKQLSLFYNEPVST